MQGLLKIAEGTLKTDIDLGHRQTTYSCKGRLIATNLNIAKLTGDKKWGKSSFNLNINAVHNTKQRFPSLIAKGVISSFCYNNYYYKNITLDGLYQNGGFDGKINLNDPNGSFQVNGKANFASKIPNININAKISKFKPNDLNLTDKYKNAEFSVRLKANVSGASLDNMIGNISIDSLSFSSPAKQYFLKNKQWRKRSYDSI